MYSIKQATELRAKETMIIKSYYLSLVLFFPFQFEAVSVYVM